MAVVSVRLACFASEQYFLKLSERFTASFARSKESDVVELNATACKQSPQLGERRFLESTKSHLCVTSVTVLNRTFHPRKRCVNFSHLVVATSAKLNRRLARSIA